MKLSGLVLSGALLLAPSAFAASQNNLVDHTLEGHYIFADGHETIWNIQDDYATLHDCKVDLKTKKVTSPACAAGTVPLCEVPVLIFGRCVDYTVVGD